MSHEFWMGLVIGVTVGEIMQMVRSLLQRKLDDAGKGRSDG